MPASETTTFLPQSKEQESNPTPYLKNNLSGSAFLINLTAPNKQTFRVKSAFNSCDLHLFEVKITLFSFKRLALNFTLIFLIVTIKFCRKTITQCSRGPYFFI